MMLLNRKKSHKTTVLITSGILVLLVAVSLLYVYGFNGNLFGWTHNKEISKPISAGAPTQEQINAGDQAKQNAANSAANQKSSSGSDQPPAPTPQQNNKSDVEVSITAANQNNPTLQIRALIYSVQSTGLCTLTLTRNAATITKTADIQPLPTTSTCKGFDIPVSELAAGTWQATLKFENDKITGTVSKAITIQ